jgi:hypothetical protein
MIDLLKQLTNAEIPEYQPPNYRNMNPDEHDNPLRQEEIHTVRKYRIS